MAVSGVFRCGPRRRAQQSSFRSQIARHAAGRWTHRRPSCCASVQEVEQWAGGSASDGFSEGHTLCRTPASPESQGSKQTTFSWSLWQDPTARGAANAEASQAAGNQPVQAVFIGVPASVALKGDDRRACAAERQEAHPVSSAGTEALLCICVFVSRPDERLTSRHV